MTQEVTHSQVEVTQAIDAREERKAFEAWWCMWNDGAEPPATTSHIFDAWLASARHRLASLASPERPVEREDTVAFVQEWMMSGDHEPSQWERDFAAAIDDRQRISEVQVAALAERFCVTPLPDSVSADPCASMPGYRNRCGTNLLTVDEAKQMLRAILSELSGRSGV